MTRVVWCDSMRLLVKCKGGSFHKDSFVLASLLISLREGKISISGMRNSFWDTKFDVKNCQRPRIQSENKFPIAISWGTLGFVEARCKLLSNHEDMTVHSQLKKKN